VTRWNSLLWQNCVSEHFLLFLYVLSFNILWKELTLSVIELAIVLLYAGEDGQGVDGGAGHAGSHTVLEMKKL
jgi:hypothetical protein